MYIPTCLRGVPIPTKISLIKSILTGYLNIFLFHSLSFYWIQNKTGNEKKKLLYFINPFQAMEWYKLEINAGTW